MKRPSRFVLSTAFTIITALLADLPLAPTPIIPAARPRGAEAAAPLSTEASP